jgi:hypothetical protein
MLKYYNNCVIFNQNVSNGLAIVTGWSNRHNIYETLSDENKKKVVACGQLYTKRGINYIIRNLFLNPQINHILICGEDLTDSLSSFYHFITSGEADFNIDDEIPQTYIEQFVNHFKNNVTYLPRTNASQFNEEIGKINISNTGWCEPKLFDDPKDLSPDTFPSEEMVRERTKISDEEMEKWFA